MFMTHSQQFRLAIIVVCAAAAAHADFAAGLKAYEDHDFVTAAKEWRALADAGDAPSQFNLGLLYLDGAGVVQNFDQAIEWFHRSADQGYVKAQHNLGALYGSGTGVRKNYVSAHIWLNLCAATGDAQCAVQRDLVAKKMKARDLAEAQRRAHEWKPIPAKASAK